MLKEAFVAAGLDIHNLSHSGRSAVGPKAAVPEEAEAVRSPEERRSVTELMALQEDYRRCCRAVSSVGRRLFGSVGVKPDPAENLHSR